MWHSLTIQCDLSSTPSISFLGFFLKEKWNSDHSKILLLERQGAESNGAWQEELLLFQLFLFLQKGGNDQSWCGLNQVIFLSCFFKTTLSCLLDNRQMFWHSGCCLIWFVFFLSILYESFRSVLDTRDTSQIGCFVSSVLNAFCRAGGGLRADQS